MRKILPILFNTESVQAILSGRKTCTRRVIKDTVKENQEINKNGKREFELYDITSRCGVPKGKIYKPPYQPGDILYVRETWAWCPCWDCCGLNVEEIGCGYEQEKIYNDEKKEHGCYIYRASCADNEYPSVDTWHPSIHMQKEAARIWLKVTSVRVERLQDIDENGAESEGAMDNRGFIHSSDDEYDRIHTAKEHFIEIWNSTIKKSDLDRYGWDANPYVWVIEFERCEKPMERLTKRVGDNITYNQEKEIECSAYCDNCGNVRCKTVKEMVRKLADYEDAEERIFAMDRAECKTCKTIKYAKYGTDERGQKFVDVLKVKITQETYKIHESRRRASLTFGASKLNYCPECGRKLGENEKKWRF